MPSRVRVTPLRATLLRVTSLRVTSIQVTSLRVTSLRVTSLRVSSHHFSSIFSFSLSHVPPSPLSESNPSRLSESKLSKLPFSSIAESSLSESSLSLPSESAVRCAPVLLGRPAGPFDHFFVRRRLVHPWIVRRLTHRIAHGSTTRSSSCADFPARLAVRPSHVRVQDVRVTSESRPSHVATWPPAPPFPFIRHLIRPPAPPLALH